MSDSTLRDQAVAHLHKTTIPYPKWAARAPRKTDRWKQAFDVLAQIGPSNDLTAAKYELTQTTASYPNWVKSVQAGAYSPPDGSGTHWGKALAALTRVGATTTQFGSDLRAAFPPLPAATHVIGPRTVSQRFDADDADDWMYDRVETTGVSHAFVADGFEGKGNRVVYHQCSPHGLSRDNPGQPDGDHNSCEGFSVHHGCEDVRIIGGEAYDVGTSRFSHAVYWGSVKRGLVQAQLSYDVGDFVYQLYPGQGEACTASLVNCTFGWTVDDDEVALVVWAESGSYAVEAVNCIIWGNVMLRGNSTLRLTRCVIPPQFSIDSDVELVECLRIDPKLTGSFVPTDPRVLTGADPGWVPPADYKGTPYSRATIGAVAA